MFGILAQIGPPDDPNPIEEYLLPFGGWIQNPLDDAWVALGLVVGVVLGVLFGFYVVRRALRWAHRVG